MVERPSIPLSMIRFTLFKNTFGYQHISHYLWE